jgi:sugar/nucleoside kinase (ribokinase family)
MTPPVRGSRVLVVGDVNVDIVLTGLPRMPQAEQEMLAAGMHTVVGGQAGTIARALARLGEDVDFVGRVGADDFGARARGALADAGVDTRGLVVDRSLPTGATVVLSAGTERAYATFPGCLAAVRASDVAPELLPGARHLHVGSYFLLSALRPEVGGLFLEARRRGLTTSLDPGWDPAGAWAQDILAVLPLVDVFLPNRAEAMAMTGAKSVDEALAALRGNGRTVVVKMGADGCLAARGEETLFCPAFAVDALDVTSAGDIFNAGFLHGFLRGWSLEESLRFAGACGALSVSRPGSSGMVSGAGQVEQFLDARGSEACARRIQNGGGR